MVLTIFLGLYRVPPQARGPPRQAGKSSPSLGAEGTWLSRRQRSSLLENSEQAPISGVCRVWPASTDARNASLFQIPRIAMPSLVLRAPSGHPQRVVQRFSPSIRIIPHKWRVVKLKILIFSGKMAHRSSGQHAARAGAYISSRSRRADVNVVKLDLSVNHLAGASAVPTGFSMNLTVPNRCGMWKLIFVVGDHVRKRAFSPGLPSSFGVE